MNDAFFAAATDGLEELEEGCVVSYRVPVSGEEFAAVAAFLRSSSVLKLEQGGFERVKVDVGWVPAGIKIPRFVLVGHKTAVQVDPFASCFVQVV
jgi:hypothetical protein